MTAAEYKDAIARLGCRSNREAAELIGVSERMARYYKAGSLIPLPVAKLLRSLLRERMREGSSDGGDEANRASGHL